MDKPIPPEDPYTNKIKVTEYAHGEMGLSEKIHPDSTLVLKYSGPLCYARIREVQVDAASVITLVVRTKERIRLQVSSSEPLLMLYMVLKGGMRFHYNLLYSPLLQQDFLLDEARQYVLLAVVFRPTALQQWTGLHPAYSQFLERADQHEPAALFAEARPATQATVYAALNLYRRTTTHHLEMMRQVSLLHLFRHAVMPLFLPPPSPPADLKVTDIEKVHTVRAYIFDHLHQPLTVRQLARLAGLNERKLKLGFHCLYHTTVAGFLREERMLRALTLLKEKKMPVAHVAAAVGYRHAPNFSDAFRRYFGHPPTLYSEINHL